MKFIEKNIYFIIFVFLLTFSACKSTKNIKSSTEKETINKVIENSSEKMFSYYYQEALRKKWQGEYDQVYELLRKAYTFKPLDDALANEFADLFFIFQDLEKGISFMKKAIELQPDNLWYKKKLSYIYIETKQFAPAIEIYENIVKHQSSNIDDLNI